MDDREILKLSLLIGLTGFVGLMVTSGMVTPEEVKVSEINRGMMDRAVSVEGYVEGVAELKNVLIIRLSDGTGTINVVIFEPTLTEIKNNLLNLKILYGRKIKVKGTIKEYRGSLELVIEEPSSLKILK